MMVDDIQRLRVRKELPEIDEIVDTTLATKVVEAWALALSRSSFEAIADIPASGNPDTPPLKTGTQTDHIRGVTRLAIAIADELGQQFQQLPLDRDLVIAAALCHDVGKPWEFDPENQTRWANNRIRTGLPSVRHPGYGVHICLTVGLPEEIAHVAGGHSGEGELVQRSLTNMIVHQADYAFWGVLRAGDLLEDET
jgi:putative nucleotidyltransferase with HDIG domain